MQDLYFWVSFPTTLGVLNSELPPKLLSAKTSIERIEEHLASTRNSLDTITPDSELTDSQLDMIEKTMCTIAALITTRRQGLVRAAIACVHKELRNLVEKFNSLTSDLETLQKHNTLFHHLKTKLKQELSVVNSLKDIELLTSLRELCKDYLNLLDTRLDNSASTPPRKKRHKIKHKDSKLIKKSLNIPVSTM